MQYVQRDNRLLKLVCFGLQRSPTHPHLQPKPLSYNRRLPHHQRCFLEANTIFDAFWSLLIHAADFAQRPSYLGCPHLPTLYRRLSTSSAAHSRDLAYKSANMIDQSTYGQLLERYRRDDAQASEFGGDLGWVLTYWDHRPIERTDACAFVQMSAFSALDVEYNTSLCFRHGGQTPASIQSQRVGFQQRAQSGNQA